MSTTPSPRRLSRLLLLPILVLLAIVASRALLSRTGSEPAPQVYAALGASDTVGVGANRPELEAWPALFHNELPAGTQLLNLGISGATLDDVLRYQLPPALDAQPRWITIWPGINDLRAGVPLQTFREQLDSLLSRLARARAGLAEPQVTLIVLTMPDLRSVPEFADVDPQALDTTVQRWNAATQEVAHKRGAILVDLYEHGFDLAAHPEYLSADGFHPSSMGYKRIADVVLGTVNRYVSSTP